MTPFPHTIARVNFNFAFDTRSQVMNDAGTLPHFIKARLVPCMDSVMADWNSEETVIRIDRLDIHLGRVTYDEMEAALSRKLRQALLDLTSGAGAAVSPVSSSRVLRLTGQQDQLELLGFYLSTGRLPWRAEKYTQSDLTGILESLLQRAPRSLTDYLRQQTASDNPVLPRLVRQFSADLMRRLASRLSPAGGEGIGQWISLLSDPLPDRSVRPPAQLRWVLWEATLRRLLLQPNATAMACDDLMASVLKKAVAQTPGMADEIRRRLAGLKERRDTPLPGARIQKAGISSNPSNGETRDDQDPKRLKHPTAAHGPDSKIKDTGLRDQAAPSRILVAQTGLGPPAESIPVPGKDSTMGHSAAGLRMPGGKKGPAMVQASPGPDANPHERTGPGDSARAAATWDKVASRADGRAVDATETDAVPPSGTGLARDTAPAARPSAAHLQLPAGKVLPVPDQVLPGAVPDAHERTDPGDSARAAATWDKVASRADGRAVDATETDAVPPSGTGLARDTAPAARPSAAHLQKTAGKVLPVPDRALPGAGPAPHEGTGPGDSAKAAGARDQEASGIGAQAVDASATDGDPSAGTGLARDTAPAARPSVADLQKPAGKVLPVSDPTLPGAGPAPYEGTASGDSAKAAGARDQEASGIDAQAVDASATDGDPSAGTGLARDTAPAARPSAADLQKPAGKVLPDPDPTLPGAGPAPHEGTASGDSAKAAGARDQEASGVGAQAVDASATDGDPSAGTGLARDTAPAARPSAADLQKPAGKVLPDPDPTLPGAGPAPHEGTGPGDSAKAAGARDQEASGIDAQAVDASATDGDPSAGTGLARDTAPAARPSAADLQKPAGKVLPVPDPTLPGAGPAPHEGTASGDSAKAAGARDQEASGIGAQAVDASETGLVPPAEAGQGRDRDAASGQAKATGRAPDENAVSALVQGAPWKRCGIERSARSGRPATMHENNLPGPGIQLVHPAGIEDLSPIESIHVDNAGMVLVAPYLPRLFGMLDLLSKGGFKDPPAAERAVHLLQYLVCERSGAPEFRLSLNKVMCGLSGGVPLPPGIDISEKEAAAVDGLIRAVISHWKIIGNTSPEGLRSSFLQRAGELTLKEAAWHLKVHGRAFDVLLDQLPWSFATIKHPWMQRVLYVHWR